MPRMIAKFVAFARWLSAPEELPSEVAGADPRDATVNRPGFSRWLLHGDTLRQGSSAEEHASDAHRFLRSVLSQETLPSVEPGATAPPSQSPLFWRWVLGGEALPVAEPADRAAWEPLWQGYLTYYKAALPDEVTADAWNRLVDPEGELIGLCGCRGRFIAPLTNRISIFGGARGRCIEDCRT